MLEAPSHDVILYTGLHCLTVGVQELFLRKMGRCWMMPIMSVSGKKLSQGKKFHLSLKPEGNSDTGEGVRLQNVL